MDIITWINYKHKEVKREMKTIDINKQLQYFIENGFYPKYWWRGADYGKYKQNKRF